MRPLCLSISYAFAVGLAMQAGCAAQRVYNLPATVAQAQSAADPLLACATQRNLRAARNGNDVEVNFDDKCSAVFNLSTQNAYSMAISLNDSQMAPVEAERAFNDAKQKSEELYACATGAPMSNTSMSEEQQQKRGASMMASSLGDVAADNDACAQLASCYSDVASLVCNSTDTQCRSTYSLQEAATQQDCQATLSDMPQMASTLQQRRPAFQIPSSCSMEQSSVSADAQPPAQTFDAIDWNGTWTALVSYKWSCRGKGTKAEAHTGSERSSYTLTIAGDALALQAEAKTAKTSVHLQGQGTPKSLQLCGPLAPAGQTAGKTGDSVCIHLTEVTSNSRASGTLTGAWSVGKQTCEPSDAKVELSR